MQLSDLQRRTLLAYCKAVKDSLPMFKYDIRKAEQRAFTAASMANPKFAAKGPAWIRGTFIPKLVKRLEKENPEKYLGRVVQCGWGTVVVARATSRLERISITRKADGLVSSLSHEEFVRYNPLLLAKDFLVDNDVVSTE